MKKFYRVNNHSGRMRPLYSIDEVFEDGSCIAQAAFFYRDRKNAFKEAARIIAEDQADGIDAAMQPGKETSVGRWTR